jgi:hypothetical protein
MSLVQHAKRELEMVGEEPEVIEWYLQIVAKFAEFGHSGATAEHTTQTLERLLRYRNLSPLTDDPDEWIDVSNYFDEEGEVLQSKRNFEAFSQDGGKTYYLLSESKLVSHQTVKKELK